MSLWILFTSSALSQSVKDDDYAISLSDLQEVARCLQDRNLLRQLNEIQAQRIANLEREIDLVKRESEIKDRLINVAERETEATRRALNDMKEVADRAIKLSEVKNPSSNWMLQGLFGLAAFTIGILVAM